MFDPSDPRGTLANAASASVVRGSAPTEYVRFDEVDPVEKTAACRTWLARGQNFVVAYSEVQHGARFVRANQHDEWVILLPERRTQVRVSVEGGGETLVEGHSLVLMPPGNSAIQVMGDGQLIRLFTSAAEDLATRAVNAASYERPHANVRLLDRWPPPPDGYKVRAYSLDVPREEGRFGRIWRCTTFMVNYLEPTVGPRDTTKMSPHTHADFEQCSLALSGDYVHHVRWPWTTDMSEWRLDDHERCPAPSVAVIPPPAVHTSQAVGTGVNQLVDIFCPPRLDFSEQPGWVLNAEDYPALPQSGPIDDHKQSY
jgi:hypothetical protein